MSKEHVDMNTPVIEMRNIVKCFGDFVANDGINLTVHKGEIHAILGENGAGKSTLMNQLYGMFKPTSGDILVNGKKIEMNSPRDAIDAGIGMVHQHFMLVQPFTVTENIVLGSEPKKGPALDMEAARRNVVEISERYGLSIDPDAKIEDISVGMQQRVEILKALYRGADILILDEPTSSLTPQEIVELIDIMHNLTCDGKSIILITHKLKEIKESADFCTIIRLGKYIATVDVDTVTESELASMMVGRNVSFNVDKPAKTPGDVVLDVRDLHCLDYRGVEILKGIDLQVRAGEIVGIAGIDGNGQTELVYGLTGLDKPSSGTITLCGKDISHASIRHRGEHMSHIPEDRHKHGLVLDFTLEQNMVLQRFNEPRFENHGFINNKAVRDYANYLIDKFDVRSGQGAITRARSMSGGNQQKAIIAREVDRDKDLIVAVQPTRGLDVGAIEFIHSQLVAERDRGKAILLVSLELDEVMSLSDRILVMYEGEIVGELDPKKTTVEELGLYMAGAKRMAKEEAAV